MKMQRTGLTTIVILVAVIFTIIELLPDETTKPIADTPWEIAISSSGNSHVLGITLGESILKDAETRWRKEPEITLFLPKQLPPKVEAYFQSINPGGIKASIVAEISMSEDNLNQLINSGARISTQGDGSRKISLDGNGIDKVMDSVISSITYLPRVNLSPQTIKNRFGKPSNIISVEDGLEHWIYPEMGLDITISSEGREVFQYVPPSQIERLTVPLVESGGS